MNILRISRAFVCVGVAFFAIHLPSRAQVILYDDFSDGLSGWQFVESCNCGYDLHLWETDQNEGVVAPALTWQKNNICDCPCENDVWCDGGQTCFECGACQSYEGYFFKTVSFPDGVLSFNLSFDWRSSSNLDWSVVTNSALRVTDENDDLISQTDLVMGGTYDTGWQYYEVNYARECEYWSEITIYFDVMDYWWQTPWCNKNWWDNVRVEVIDQDNSPALAESNSPVCMGETIVLAASGGESYTWSGPNSFSSSTAQVEINDAALNDSGEYTVLIIDSMGCEHFLSLNVIVEDEVIYNEVFTLCDEASYTLPDGQVVNEPGIYETLIENNDGCDSLIITNLEFAESFHLFIDTILCPESGFTDANGNVIESSGQYSFEYVSVQGCDSILYYNISIETVEIDTVVVQICSGDEYLTLGGNLINSAGEYLEFDDTGEGCGSYFLYSVSLFPQPIAAFSYNPEHGTSSNSSAVFENTSEGFSDSYWELFDLGTFFTNTLYIDFGEDANTYTVCLIVENEFECADSTCVNFEVWEDVNLFIPNVITPNGDGINDLFYVVGSGLEISEFELLIFNRWGELIFESNSIASKWDGRNRTGTHYVSDGVYLYIVRVGLLNSPERIERTGHITVFR